MRAFVEALRQWLRPLITRRQISRAATEWHYKTLGECPQCRSSARGHDTYRVASAVVRDGTSHLASFRSSIHDGGLERILGDQEFDGASDAHVLYAVKCPETGIVTLKLLFDPEELWADPFLMDEVVLSAADSARLMALKPARPLDGDATK